MTDKELRDAAVAELKLTTAGWRKSNGNQNYPSGSAPQTTHWGKAMTLLEQISQAPPPPPPPPPGAKPLTNSITSGGTYTGHVSGTVFIRTLEPVVLDTFSIDGGSGYMIDAYHDIPGQGVDLTIRKGTINGADAYGSPRWLVAQNWKNLLVERCTITNTRGIELWTNRVANPKTVIRQCLHRNIKGTTAGNSLNEVGNFVQLRVIWGGPSDGGVNPNPGLIEMYWNEIVNEHNKSNPEDVFSIYKTARTRIHDNLINGQTKPDSMTGSSQNSITIDPANEPQLLYDNQILNNFVIDAYSVGMFGGNNNLMQGNYIVSDGYNGDTGQQMRYGYSGLFCSSNGSGNVLKDNHVGYIGNQGRVDFQQDGGTWTGNVALPNPITRQTELDHIAMFHQRAAAAGVVIGV